MAITEWQPYHKLEGSPPTFFERLRRAYWLALAKIDMAYTAWNIRRMIAQDVSIERKRVAKIETEMRRADNVKRSSLRREMVRMERAISGRLTSLEFAHWTPRPDKRGRYRISRIRFAQRVATPSRIFLRIDTARLPRGRGITTQNLMEQEVLDELSLACQAPVSYERHYERGFWYIVDMGGKLSAIPSIVERREAIEQMPLSAGPLDVPFGIGNYRRFYHINIEETPHMIVAGATGFGKSVFIHNILTYIIEHTKPEQVRLALADLKGGAELGRYDGIPHLFEGHGSIPVEPRIYSKRDDTLDMLRAILYEVERRLQLFAEEKVSKLSSWNQKHHNRALPRILVVVDEIQNAMLDSKTRGEMEAVLVDIASRARATGIHVIIATQRPSVDVITGLIKANFPSRVAFNCFSIHDSKTILDTTEAANLGRPGLMVFRGLGNRAFRCQSPWLTEGLIQEVIDNTIEGVGKKVETRNVGVPDILDWAIHKNDGQFTIDGMYQTFRAQGITYAECRRVWADITVRSSVEVAGKLYKFVKRNSHLIEVDQTGEPVGKVTIETLLRWSLAEQGGQFSYREIYKAFSRDLSSSRCKALIKQYEGKTVTIDDVIYKLNPGDGGRKPRHWVQVQL